METPSLADLELIKEVDDVTKWAVARAYRAKRQERYGDYEARWAAIDAFQEMHPDRSMRDVQRVVALVIVQAYRNHTAWMNEGVKGPMRDDRVR